MLAKYLYISYNCETVTGDFLVVVYVARLLAHGF